MNRSSGDVTVAWSERAINWRHPWRHTSGPVNETECGSDMHLVDWLAIASNEYLSWWLVSEVAFDFSLDDLASSSLISNRVVFCFVSSPSQTEVWSCDKPKWCLDRDTVEAPMPTPMIWLVRSFALFVALQSDAAADAIASSSSDWRGSMFLSWSKDPELCGSMQLKQTVNWLLLSGGLENEPKHWSDNTTIWCVADSIDLAFWHDFVAMLVLMIVSYRSPS